MMLKHVVKVNVLNNLSLDTLRSLYSSRDIHKRKILFRRRCHDSKNQIVASSNITATMFLISNNDNTHNTELDVNWICLIILYLSLLHSSVIGRLSTRSTEWLSNPNRNHWLFFLTWVENDYRRWTRLARMKVRIPRDDFFCATMKRNRNVHQTEAFYDYLGKKISKAE